tara:strand:- start:840 stop:1115 length:276 start_codon:yes stop_codon:yes gene_type:complete
MSNNLSNDISNDILNNIIFIIKKYNNYIIQGTLINNIDNTEILLLEFYYNLHWFKESYSYIYNNIQVLFTNNDIQKLKDNYNQINYNQNNF